MSASRAFRNLAVRAYLVGRRWLSPTARREERQLRSDFEELAGISRGLLREVPSFPAPTARALVVAGGLTSSTRIELVWTQALRLAGLEPVVLLDAPGSWAERSFRLWGQQIFVYWRDHIPAGRQWQPIAALQNFEDVLALDVDGAPVGKYVASQLMRRLRVGRFDPRQGGVWKLLLAELERGARHAAAARSIVASVAPRLALFIERGYSPWGQLFDACIAAGVDTLQWVGAHRGGALMLKRYNPGNQHLHPATLSAASWRRVRAMPWGADRLQRVRDELQRAYVSGDWFSEVGTQFHKTMPGRGELEARLGLDPRKKTAVIFPHMFWDATFFYGRDLFRDYEEWFVETVRQAAANRCLNWIVKVHPANVTKAVRDGYLGEFSETQAMRGELGSIPDHVKLIGADSDISTLALFPLMDYCITVRGTVGIEASLHGIPTLTAGTGRYDHLGFTIDSETREDFLARLARLHEHEGLSEAQKELAARFAYGMFMLRPFVQQAATLEYERDRHATARVRFHVATLRELAASPDVAGLAAWIADGREEDWLSAPV